MADGSIKRGDTWPPLTFTLSSSNDGGVTFNPVDLTTATTVKVLLKTGNVLITGTATKDPDQTANRGKATYTWVAGDTDDVGLYNGEVEITWSNGKIQTFPVNPATNDPTYFTFEIEQDLG